MSIFSETLRVLWLICLWCAFIFVALASIAMAVIGVWPWGAMFFLVGFIGLSAIDTVLKGGIGYESNGGLFHHFFIFVHSISAVGLIVLTVLTAFGVLRTADTMLWTPETNFASWYMVGGLFITYFLIQPTEPNDDIPDLQAHGADGQALNPCGCCVGGDFHGSVPRGSSDQFHDCRL